MKKLIFIALLIVGCDESVLDNSDTEIKNYENLSWAARVEYGGYLDSTYHYEDSTYNYGWHQEYTDTVSIIVIDTIIFIPTYIANCYYVDTLNQCSSLKPHLLYNGFEEDTTSFNHWSEIRLPNNQIDYNFLTIELITGNGLVNPYEGITFYEYIED